MFEEMEISMLCRYLDRLDIFADNREVFSKLNSLDGGK
jgi:hypothetical protein